jgi:hypothetical protein
VPNKHKTSKTLCSVHFAELYGKPTTDPTIKLALEKHKQINDRDRERDRERYQEDEEFRATRKRLKAGYMGTDAGRASDTSSCVRYRLRRKRALDALSSAIARAHIATLDEEERLYTGSKQTDLEPAMDDAAVVTVTLDILDRLVCDCPSFFDVSQLTVPIEEILEDPFVSKYLGIKMVDPLKDRISTCTTTGKTQQYSLEAFFHWYRTGKLQLTLDDEILGLQRLLFELEYISVELYRGSKRNCGRIEAALQAQYIGLELGTQRLWSKVGAGHTDGHVAESHNVFITFSFKAVQAILDKKIKLSASCSS